MYQIFFFVGITVVTISVAFGQSQGTKRTHGPKKIRSATTRVPDSADWRIVRIEKLGVMSIELPVRLLDEGVEKGDPNPGDPGLRYIRRWEKPGVGAFSLPPFSVDILVTTKKKRLRFDPEFLMKFMYDDGKRFKLTEEVKYLELDQVRGVFSLSRVYGNDDQVYVNWSSLRDYQNMEQYISLSIDGPREDLPEILRILHSMRFK